MKCVLAFVAVLAVASASCPNACNGHGTCFDYDTCVCQLEQKTSYFGYLYDTSKGYDRVADGSNSVGAQVFAELRSSLLDEAVYEYSDSVAGTSGGDADAGVGARYRQLSKFSFVQAAYTFPDCSGMTCPRGVSWTKRHPEDNWLHSDFAECSDMGTCDRSTGECKCMDGFGGPSCSRMLCPNDCSGAGICTNNLELSRNAEYVADKSYKEAWDTGIAHGCLCNNGFRGEDCSLRECPSSNDVEGGKGNFQGRDCSGRGLCDYKSGECNCFSGYTGAACEMKSLVV